MLQVLSQIFLQNTFLLSTSTSQKMFLRNLNLSAGQEQFSILDLEKSPKIATLYPWKNCTHVIDHLAESSTWMLTSQSYFTSSISSSHWSTETSSTVSDTPFNSSFDSAVKKRKVLSLQSAQKNVKTTPFSELCCIFMKWMET